MIGVFDSGYGGLTVLKELTKSMPQYDFVYLGDNAHAPYGDRSHEVIKEFTEKAINFLFSKGCVLIIIACNTASSQVLRELQNELLVSKNVKDKKILGVIKPIAEEVVKITKNNKVGVIGTRSTINSNSYLNEITKLNKEIKLYSLACPLLVPLVEENWIKKPETKMIMKKYLKKLKSTNIDTLILGCTHYPILMKNFKVIMGKKINIPNTGEIVANSLINYLKNHTDIDKLITKNGNVSYFTSGDPDNFAKNATIFLNKKVKDVQKIDL